MTTDELDAVRDMFGADFAELAMLFRRDAPGRIAALRVSGGRSDLAAMAQAAHAFSGSAASMGASSLSLLCKELELSCRAGNAAGVAGKVDEIDREYQRIGARLATMTRP